MSECLTFSSTTGANGNAPLSSSTTSDSSTLAASANVSMCMSSSLSPECLTNSEIPPRNQDFRLFSPLTSDIEEGCSEPVTKVHTDCSRGTRQRLILLKCGSSSNQFKITSYFEVSRKVFTCCNEHVLLFHVVDGLVLLVCWFCVIIFLLLIGSYDILKLVDQTPIINERIQAVSNEKNFGPLLKNLLLVMRWGIHSKGDMKPL